MGNKSIAKQGSEEIGSCLLKYITCITSQATISDNCGGKRELGYCSPAQLPYL